MMRELGKVESAPPSPVSPLPLQELQLGKVVADHVTSHVTNLATLFFSDGRTYDLNSLPKVSFLAFLLVWLCLCKEVTD